MQPTIVNDDLCVRFDEWTGTRVPVVIGTNAGSEPLAFQNWRRFKEAFAPELIKRAVIETSQALNREVLTCLDPCAGSGTTALASQFLGVIPVTIEVNPFLADLIEAKLTAVDANVVARRCAEVLATTKKVDPREFYAAGPATFVEPGVSGRYLFSYEVAERLAGLLNAILSIREEPVRRLFRILLGSAALDVCNATVSGKGRRYRRNWATRRVGPKELDHAFATAVEAAVFDISRYLRRQTLGYVLLRGDARQKLDEVGEVDLAVFSPPYPNSFDYTDVYNIELWALGYLRSSADNAELRHSTVRSHVQIDRDYSASRLTPKIAVAVANLRAAEKLWNKHIPDMIGAYFADLQSILAKIRSKLPLGGRVYVVVGDSKYAGVEVPVAAALADVAADLGFEIKGVEPFRSMRASPQQGGRLELAESLLIFSAA
jgi:DNA modification methylase